MFEKVARARRWYPALESGRFSAPARILIVDDHPVLRSGLSVLLGAQPDLIVCGNAENEQQAVWLFSCACPHLVIADLSPSIERGLMFIRLLRAMNAEARILALSMHDDMRLADRVLHAGAFGFVNVSAPADELVAAVRRILESTDMPAEVRPRSQVFTTSRARA